MVFVYVVANLLMIVGLIVTTTIAYYNFKAVTPDEAEKFIVLRFNSDKYNNDNNTKLFIDEFQSLQQCCGNEGKKNYIDDGNFPQSCCSQDDFDRQTCYKNSYKMGCVTKIPEMMQELNAIIYNKYSERKVLLTAAIVIGINEFLSVVLALKLAQSIARNRRRSYVA
ncbi:uncharacterized protein LOC122849463 [Aphidius gifuensis]|uniref:uncharacterized protein LOC122849463 n=1 Tax=Aphidius gifuensis TaxID=684658 RepID=UPI001CDC1137|nr:uncharacterized protein LOC122849463 [Aphidius gifuensis]